MGFWRSLVGLPEKKSLKEKEDDVVSYLDKLSEENKKIIPEKELFTILIHLLDKNNNVMTYTDITEAEWEALDSGCLEVEITNMENKLKKITFNKDCWAYLECNPRVIEPADVEQVKSAWKEEPNKKIEFPI